MTPCEHTWQYKAGYAEASQKQNALIAALQMAERALDARYFAADRSIVLRKVRAALADAQQD